MITAVYVDDVILMTQKMINNLDRGNQLFLFQNILGHKIFIYTLQSKKLDIVIGKKKNIYYFYRSTS